ncbi:hypothetical protein C3B55_00209 [Candidatus Pseudomonas adelgestsugas]|uniref:O-antigen ligase-related domain-containing protein n=1 Tax=Candidatus Pseudomonas adelgestsugas TaxID=1302376 RepID=A0ABX5R7E8_9PSED|nr:O-antigen ligase family protein [Candidatus Pseudomonas adelgestsugas]QAX81572.1 hypothetical protein C3B55_00209 [Candidatus Pseudomonas adelgestsugas]
MQSQCLTSGVNRVFDFLVLWILPIGLLLLLSSLFYVENRNVMHRLYYSFFSMPTLLLLCLRPKEIQELLREPLIIAFLAFCIWAIMSVLWSPEPNRDSKFLKAPLQTFMLFAGCGVMLHYRNELFKPILFSAAIIALVVCIDSLIAFAKGFKPGLSMRMIGGLGALDNPLLSSHVFGFFCVYWLCICISTKNLQVFLFSMPALAIMTLAILATGSRMALAALTLSALWIAFVGRNYRAIITITTYMLGTISFLLFNPKIIAERGSSYRFELWGMTLQRIIDQPFIGHGYNSKLSLIINNTELMEPHSFILSVLYYVGIIGLIPWIFMLGWGLHKGLKEQTHPLFLLTSALLIYGIGAGLTEGGDILSRPKEHWFLLWIPLAMIAGLSIAKRRSSMLHMPAPSFL